MIVSGPVGNPKAVPVHSHRRSPNPYRLTNRNSAALLHYVLVLIHMGDLHLVLPALNLYTLDAGILIMVQQVRLMMFSFNMVDYSMSFMLKSIKVVVGGRGWPTGF